MRGTKFGKNLNFFSRETETSNGSIFSIYMAGVFRCYSQMQLMIVTKMDAEVSFQNSDDRRDHLEDTIESSAGLELSSPDHKSRSS